MNLLKQVHKLEIFIAQWAGTTMPRIVVAFLGILICVWIGMAIWEKRIRILGTVVGMVLGLFMVLISIDPRILHFLADTSFLARIRIMMIVLSFLVIVITVEAIRRSHLQERYAILWVTTGLIILMTAFFPHVLTLFSFLLGTQYVTSVVGIVFTFLLLISFHFSIALSGMQKRQTQIAQRCAILEAKLEDLSNQVAALSSGRKSEECQADEERVPAEPALPISQPRDDIRGKSGSARQFTGPQIASSIIIGLSFMAVLITGIITPQAMVGDEVTHYYILTTQAENLSQPNFFANIPTGWGEVERRRYPHSCFWHYGGALLYRLTGGSFFAVQVYQALFWLQLLWVAYLLARSLLGGHNKAVILYMLILATLPVCLIFSVTFYQDIPMAAQVLMAFYFLHRSRWFLATLFLGLAIAMKISALLFVPPFLLCLAVWKYRSRRAAQTFLVVCVAMTILGAFTWGISWSLKQYGGVGFYPVQQIHKAYARMQQAFVPKQSEPQSSPEKKDRVTPRMASIIANHPGDLRIAKNYIIYGGGVLWVIMLVGGLTIGIRKCRRQTQGEHLESPWWFFGVGIWYVMLTAYFLSTAPDARFFLPGIPFLLLPFAEGFSLLPRFKILLCIIAALAILQGGQVLKKTYDLRHLSKDLQEGIAFLKATPLDPPRIFMYPEGNYRFFPYRHDWYMDYYLRWLWRSDNDKRIRMLQHFGIGAVVIKKYLIADVDEAITNLGVYPAYFVRALEKDGRFKKLFENREVIIYRVPLP